MVNPMTVRDLVEELEQFPMDLPVVTDVKEISSVDLDDGMYYLDNSSTQYVFSSAVVLG